MQVHNGRLSEAKARSYFQQLIDGVEYCHSKGVYHRDLKVLFLLASRLLFFFVWFHKFWQSFASIYSLKIFYLIPKEI